MIRIGDKIYRNLEEQVRKNQEDILYLATEGRVLDEFGIKVVGQAASYDQLLQVPTEGLEYGDTYAVGDAPPYTLYVWTRANTTHPQDYWFDVGEFPLAGPEGPQGAVGPAGATGKAGATWIAYAGSPGQYTGTINVGDLFLNSSTGEFYRCYIKNGFERLGSLRGPQGIQGPVGSQGIQGIQGPVGPTGPRGPAGITVQYKGKVSSLDALPDPNLVERNSAYILDENPEDIDYPKFTYVIAEQGGSLVWMNAGPTGVQGPEGPQGPAGEGIAELQSIDFDYGSKEVTESQDGQYILETQAALTADSLGTRREFSARFPLPFTFGAGVNTSISQNGTKLEIKPNVAYWMESSPIDEEPEVKQEGLLYIDGSTGFLWRYSASQDLFFQVTKNHFPIGSVFETESDSNPGDLFGGGWEQISSSVEEVVLLTTAAQLDGASVSLANGATYRNTLTASQIQKEGYTLIQMLGIYTTANNAAMIERVGYPVGGGVTGMVTNVSGGTITITAMSFRGLYAKVSAAKRWLRVT